MIRISGIKIPIEIYNDKTLKKEISKKIQILEKDINSIEIKKLSIDARKKPELFYVTEVDITVTNEKKILNKHN